MLMGEISVGGGGQFGPVPAVVNVWHDVEVFVHPADMASTCH